MTTAYIPRPEWYFLFLFQMLKYFPRQAGMAGPQRSSPRHRHIWCCWLLPFLDRNQKRHYSKRKIGPDGSWVIVVAGIVGLTIIAAVTTPPQEPLTAANTIPQQIALGQNLWSVNCTQLPRPGRRGRP